MRGMTVFIFFLGLIILTGSLKKSSVAPWGDPQPPHQNEMLQEQTEEDEEENRYDVEEPDFLEETDDEIIENDTEEKNEGNK
jgi:hypothetical protein